MVLDADKRENFSFMTIMKSRFLSWRQIPQKSNSKSPIVVYRPRGIFSSVYTKLKKRPKCNSELGHGLDPGFITLTVLVMIFVWLMHLLLVFIVLGGVLGFWSYRRWSSHKRWLRSFHDSGIEDIDESSDLLLEHRLQIFFSQQGWKLSLNAENNHCGANLVGKDAQGFKVVIQAKRYQSAVGFRVIQEVLEAGDRFGAERTLVITNNSFTTNAQNLAYQNRVELWDRTRLIEALGSLIV